MRVYDPFNSLVRLQEEIERAFERPFGFGPAVGISGRGAFPPVNVFQGQDGYVARFEVPGLGSDDVCVEAHGRSLTVSGKREPLAPAEGSLHRRETWSGEFSRSFQFPEDANPSRARAECRHGVLTVHVPLREEARPRRIEIRTSQEEK